MGFDMYSLREIRAVNSALAVMVAAVILVTGCGKSADDLYTNGKRLLLDEKTFEKGIGMLEKFEKNNPDDPRTPEVILAVAAAFQGDGQPEKAEQSFLRLIEHYPQSAESCKALFLLGYMYYDMPDATEKARAALEKFIAAYPDSELTVSARILLENLGRPVDEWSIVRNLNDSTTSK